MNNCKVFIRNEPIIEFSKIKKGVEISRTDRVAIIDSNNNPIEDPAFGFQERGFVCPKLLEIKKVENILHLEKAVLLYSNQYGEWNFEHWMLDVLPKAWSASKKSEFGEISFVVTDGQFRELTEEYLAHIGVLPEKIINIEEIDLYVAELFEFTSSYSHPFSTESAEFIKHFRGKLVENRQNEPKKKSRLYLGRTEINTAGSGRIIQNLPEVLEMLDSEGFEFVSAGDLNLSQKHSLFSNSDIVLTEIGANCLNVLISSGVKKFIQIGHRRWKKTYYSDIFNILNPESGSVCMFFETSDPNHNSYKSPEGVNVPWIVDIERLKSEITSFSRKA